MSGYTSFDLRKYAETIQTLPLKGLSVSGLESLSRANLAIYHMLISDSLDDIYGNRKKYLARIKRCMLFAAAFMYGKISSPRVG